VRIIAGDFRGRRLAGLGKGDAGAQLRPTSDRVRESLFNVLAGRDDVRMDGARVLDVFAGTGALGLEALSRGAGRAVFIENGRTALALLQRNIALCGAEEACRILRRDARHPGAPPGPPHDLVFLDPPYGKGMGEVALAALFKGGWIAGGATVIWEEGAEIHPPDGLHLLVSRRYGETCINLLRLAGG